MALERQQAECGDNGKHHHGDANTVVLQGHWVDKPPGRFQQQETGRARDKRRLAQARQRLRLAVAKAVLPVRGRQGVAHGQQVDQGGQRIQGGIDQGRQQAEGVGHTPGDELGQDEHQRHRYRGIGRLPHQAGRLRRHRGRCVGIGFSHGRGYGWLGRGHSSKLTFGQGEASR